MVKNRRGSNISELGDELWVEILCRLGLPKYAFRCKSVCKLWCALIDTNSSSHSYFSRRWHQINGKEAGDLPVFLLTKYESRLFLDHSSSDDLNTKEVPTFNLNFLPCRSNHGDQVCVLSACRDLLLCCPNRYDHSCYYLCNPFTKQWTALPPTPPLPVDNKYRSVRVGLSVYDEGHARGSSFAVVHVVSCRTGFQDVHILVFSSDGSNCGWRNIDSSDELHPWGYLCTNVVSYNGDYVWITIPYDSTTDLIGFNLNPCLDHISVYQPEFLDESFSGSPGYRPNIATSIIGVSQGHLRLAELVDDRKKLIVWQITHGPRQVWEKVQELDFSEFEDSEDLSKARACYQHKNGRRKTSILAFHPRDGDILYLFFSLPIYEHKPIVSSYTFSCNLTRKRLELIREIPVVIRNDSFFPLVLPGWPTSVPQLIERESSQVGSSP